MHTLAACPLQTTLQPRGGGPAQATTRSPGQPAPDQPQEAQSQPQRARRVVTTLGKLPQALPLGRANMLATSEQPRHVHSAVLCRAEHRMAASSTEIYVAPALPIF